MTNLLTRLEKPFMAVAAALGQQPHLNAIRDGVVGALPLVLIGSLFLLLGQPPLPVDLMAKYMAITVPRLPAAVQGELFPVLFLMLLIVAGMILLAGILTKIWRMSWGKRVALCAAGSVVGLLLALWYLHGQLPHLQQVWQTAAESGGVTVGPPLFMQFLTVFRVLVGVIGVFVAFGVAHSLARRYELDPLSAGLLAAGSLLLINGITLATPLGLEKADKFLGIANLGSGGLFMAILLGLVVPQVQRMARERKWEITMPAGVPPAVGRSFSALIPGLIVMVPLWVLVHLLGVDLFALINGVLTGPVQHLSESGTSLYVVLLVIIVIDSVLWLLGVHAVAILAPMAAIWLINITANGTAVDTGQLPLYLNTREAMQFYIWVGGSGATIALPFLLLRARSVSLRAIAKMGAVPALFNINEPLIFGVPVMMNVTLALPFLLAPIVTMTTTVIAVKLGWVPVPSLVVPWTLPGPFGAYLATRGAWEAAVLSTVNIALAALIYWPFVRALDRRMAAQEAAQAATATPV